MTTELRRKPLKLYVWRISNYKDLSGRGGLAVDGRWHSRPQLIVYCSDEAKTAYSEILPHFGGHAFLIPDSYVLLEISVPSRLKIETVNESDLPEGWSGAASIGWPICQPIGNSWLQSGSTPVLKVPSVARAGYFNYLLNPVHRDCESIKIERSLYQPWSSSLDL